MKTLHLRKSVDRSPLRHALLFIPLLVTCVLLPPSVKAGECTVPNCGTGKTCVTVHANILGDNADFHNNTSAGCQALDNAQTSICGDNSGPCGSYYSGPVMLNDTAFGTDALWKNIGGGDQNSAFGTFALEQNTTGSFNTATGFQALASNKIGVNNTATGASALLDNIGNNNTAIGVTALRFNGAGIYNTATGVNALYYNTAGNANTADGLNALYHNTGSNNTALGVAAGYNLTTGSGNVCIGQGVSGPAGESNTTRIKNIYSSVAVTRPVYINSSNKIGTLASTRRVKENIKPMDTASEAILTFRPVSFRYKKEIDASRTPQFGLIAEDVADINPDLVTRDAEGKPETVRYDSINAMLLNEFLKEHRTVQELKKEIAALTATVQKVSAQVEMNRPAPQTVVDNH